MNKNDKIRITEGHLSKYASHAETQRVVLDYAVYFFMFIWCKFNSLDKFNPLQMCQSESLEESFAHCYENFLPYFKILQQSAYHI